MAHPSSTDLLVLHAVRLKGFADTDAVAARFDLDTRQTREDLLDAQAHGWVTRSAFADTVAWSLTEAGRRQNEAQLRHELDSIGARNGVAAVHEEFLPLNAQATQVFTAWQLGPAHSPATPLTPASGPHRTDVHRQLGDIADGLRRLEQWLTAHLARFTGYHNRFISALARVSDDPVWITGVEVDSCHRIWFELHEDLIATLGVPR